MQYYYNYDKRTKEYTGSGVANINPVATKREGKEVYYAPAYATLKKPPTVNKYKVPVYINDAWVVKDDYRGAYICDENLNIQIVTTIGELPEGFIVISEEEAQQIKNDALWYVIEDGELIKNPNYDEQKEAQRKERLAHYGMTKYDFYKYVCQPNDISYPQLLQIISSSEEMRVAWDLCVHVFRGDEILCRYIKEYLPDITDEILDELFEGFGKYIGD